MPASRDSQLRKQQIEQALRDLNMEPLTEIWRSYGFQVFEFGIQRPFRNRRGRLLTQADRRINITCAWRLYGPDGPIAISADFGPGRRRDELSIEIQQLLGSLRPVVVSVEADYLGGIRIDLSGGLVIATWRARPEESNDKELWRYLRQDRRAPHYVVTTQGIELN